MVPQSSRNSDIEALRGYAIAITFVAHLDTLVPEWRPWIGYFWLGGGVDLFFCLSGFLITHSLLADARSQPSFRSHAFRFWIRRMFRLLPAALFWSTLTVVIAFLAVWPTNLGREHDLLLTWAASALSMTDIFIYACANGHFSECHGNALWHYWSLSLEEKFYLFLPLILFFVPRKGALILIFSALALLQVFHARPWGTLLWFIRSDSLLFGSTIALLMHCGYDQCVRRYLNDRATLSKVILSAGMISLIVLAKPGISIFYMGLVALSATVVVFLVAPDQKYLTRSQKAYSLAYYVGSRSYSLYLVHMPTIALTRDFYLAASPSMLDTQTGRTGAAFVALVISIALAEFSYRVIETPLRLLGRRLTSGESPTIDVSQEGPIGKAAQPAVIAPVGAQRGD